MKRIHIELRKSLSPTNVWALAFGCIIGGSAFFMPGDMFLLKAGPLGTAIGMGCATILMIVIAMNYHFMIVRCPKAGGEFSYAQDSFGRTNAFVCAWFLGLSYVSLVPLNGTLLGIIGRHMAGGILRFGFNYKVAGFDVYCGEILAAIGVMTLIAWINVRGVKVAGFLQMIFSVALIGGVFTVGGAALFSEKVTWHSLAPLFPEGHGAISGVLTILAVSPWAFVGFDTIPQAAEEFSFSHSKSRMIMIFAILSGCVIYLILNTVTASVIPPGYSTWQHYLSAVPSLRGIEALPTFYAAKSLLGNWGLVLLGVSILAASLTGVLGFYVASSRLIYSMARESMLPDWFGRLDPRYGTPKNAIMFVLIFAIVAPFFGRTVLCWVVDMAAIGAAVGFGYTSAATLKTAWAERSWLMALSGAIGALAAIFFALLLLIPIKAFNCSLDGEEYIALIVWVGLGCLFFKKATSP